MSAKSNGTWQSIGRGVEATIEGDHLVMRVPVSAAGRKAAPLSASGKNRVIGSTGGNVSVNTDAGPVKVGLNVYCSPA